MTLLLDRPSTGEATTTPPKGTQHYFHKDQLDRLFLVGPPVVALCGFVKGDAAKDPKGLPVCEECAAIYENVVGSNLPFGPDNPRGRK